MLSRTRWGLLLGNGLTALVFAACGGDGGARSEPTQIAGAGGEAGAQAGGTGGSAGRATDSAGAAGSPDVAGSAGMGGVGPGPQTETICGPDERCVRAMYQQWGSRTTHASTHVAFDSKGNVYAVSGRGVGNLRSMNGGLGYFDLGLVKWNEKLEPVWARYCGTPDYDNELDLFITPTDEVRILEFSGPGPNGPDGSVDRTHIQKVSSLGEDQGFEPWNQGSMGDVLSSMRYIEGGMRIGIGGTRGARDGNVNVGGENDVFVALFAADDTQKWITRFGSDDRDYISGFARDAAGNTYLTGLTEGAFPTYTFAGGTYDIYLAKVSPSGDLLWVKQWGSDKRDNVNNIAISGDKLYLAGGTPRGSGAFEKNDVYLSQLDLDGNTLWTKELPIKTDGGAIVMTAAENGLVYLAFDSENETLPLRKPKQAFASDMFLTEWNESGEVKWLATWGSESHDYAFDIATFKNRVAVVGRAQDSLPGFSVGEGAFLAVFDVDPIKSK